MKNILRTGLWLLLACASSSHAIIVPCDASLGLDCAVELSEDGVNATKIYNLEITDPNTGTGTFYNVVFDYVTVGTVGSTPDVRDVFDGNKDYAEAAALTLAAVLTPTGALTAKAPGSAAVGLNFVVPYSYAGTASDTPCTSGLVEICGWRVSSSFTPPTNVWTVGSIELEGGIVNFARFEPPTAPVPLPPAAFLFGSGLLAMLGWARRRPGGVVSS